MILARRDGGSVSRKKSGSIKITNDFPDKLSRTVERHNNGLTLENLRLPERYVKNELRVLVYFREGNGPEYCVSFQRDCRTHRSLKIERRFHSRSQGIVLYLKEFLLDFRSVAWEHTLQRVRRSHCQHQVMLVPDIEFVNIPEKFATPSSVWLDTPQRLNYILPQSLFYSYFFGFVFLGSQERFLEFDSILANGKVQTRERASPSRKFHSRKIGKVIQRTTQIVNSIPKHQANLGGDRQDVLQAINSASRLRIVLMGNSISVFFVNELAPEAVKITDVLFGPF